MVNFNQLKALGTDLIGKAGDLAEQAKEKAGPLAEQAKEKIGPLAEQAKEKAGPLAVKAKDAAAKGVDKAADGIDSATGGKYKGKIDSVSDRLGNALHSDSPADDLKAAATESVVGTDSATTVSAESAVVTDPASPWPAANNPDLPPATVLDA